MFTRHQFTQTVWEQTKQSKANT